MLPASARCLSIGGDRKQPAGPYESALPLLEDIAQYTGGLMRAGIAGYPEGHPSAGRPWTCWTRSWPSSTWPRTL